MNIKKHNQYCKLIGVTIDNKEFVLGQNNNGTNQGLEVYYKTDNNPSTHFYYSRRFTGRKIPVVYDRLAMYLEKLLPYCPDGNKMTLEISEYQELIVLFNTRPPKYLLTS